MNSQQPEALRLADALENNGNDCTCMAYGACECGCDANWAEYSIKEAAAELRRLHSVNAMLLEALREMVEMMNSGEEHGAGSPWHKQATAAIAAAKGEA